MSNISGILAEIPATGLPAGAAQDVGLRGGGTSGA
jgi:hypothetical protein